MMEKTNTQKLIDSYRPPKWCSYPYTRDPLGYCWSWAYHQDGDPGFIKARDGFCRGCEMNKDES